jgi:hypothetical protein
MPGRWVSLSLDTSVDLHLDGRDESGHRFGGAHEREPNLPKSANLSSIMRLYYAGLADVRALVHDVFRHDASPCRPMFRRTVSHCRFPPGSLHVMVFMVAFLLIPGAACLRPGFGTLRPIEVSLRRLAKPASTRALDCPPSSQRQRIGKSFRKPQSMLMSFPVGTRTSRRFRGSCISAESIALAHPPLLWGKRASRRIGGARRNEGVEQANC